MKTIRAFQTDYPVLQSLGDDWFLIAHPNGPAISTTRFEFLGSLAHPCADVPEAIRTKAIEAVMDFAWRLHKEGERLLGFAGAILTQHRDDGDVGDVDGGTIQEAAEKFGLLEYKEVKEPCGENCHCAENTDFPTHCYFLSPLGQRAVDTKLCPAKP